MTVYVDTSAYIALLDADDINHAKAKARYQQIAQEQTMLISANYVIVETIVLIQRRLGMDAVRIYIDTLLPVVQIEWIDPAIHATALQSFLVAGRRQLSLVDCISFAVMFQLEISSVFTYDKHFREQGFICLT